MFDAKRLLDQFLGAGGVTGIDGSRQGSGLDGLLGGAGGMLGNLQNQARENPMMSGALAGGLASLVLGSGAGRELAGDAVKLGGLALVGGLAYKAYRDYQARQAGTSGSQTPQGQIAPPPSNTPFMPKGNEADQRARLLVTAMISAAKADGHIDAAEQKRIFDRLDTVSLDTESKAYVMDQLRAPLDLDGIVKAASSPEVATEVYAASLLCIDPDHPAEKAYLQMLAARLSLPDELVQEVHKTAEAARVTA